MSCPSPIFIAFASWIWHIGELRFQDPCTYFTVGKVKASTLSLTVLATCLKCFGANGVAQQAIKPSKSLLQHHWLVRIQTCISKIYFSHEAFIHFLGIPSLSVDSALSWIRDSPKFHPESSSDSASSRTASGGHRNVKCLQRGVGGRLIAANGPVGESMAGRRMYGPLSLHEHHEREHNAIAYPSLRALLSSMLSIQWCRACLKVLSSSTLLLSWFW